MPIIEPPRRGTTLSQGDILTGIQLFYSKKGPGTNAHVAEDTKCEMCLILSRQCVIEHKKTLIVSAVMRYSQDVSTEMTFEEAVDFLMTVRDGINSPDQFYLGHLPGMSGRYSARLDSLHTVEFPLKPDERQVFIDEHRIARLGADFIRALHMRVLGAFGNMGFEDYRWLSDGDLTLLVEKGNSEIRKVEEDQRIAGLTRVAAGRPTDAKQNNKDQNVIDAIKKKVEPYSNELARRSPESPEVDT